MTKKVTIFLVAIIAFLIPLAFFAPVQAGQSATPRPEVFTLNTAVITNATTWTGPDTIGQHEKIDVFYIIDQTDINTLTLTLQVSPDNTNWADHSTKSAVVTSNAADATSYITGGVEGLYYRITSTHGNTSEVTPTIKVVLR